MTPDAHPPQNPTGDAAAPASLWSALTRWRASASAAHADPELGYESAQPWTLGDATDAETGQPPR